jgi:hypothetical protein
MTNPLLQRVKATKKKHILTAFQVVFLTVNLFFFALNFTALGLALTFMLSTVIYILVLKIRKTQGENKKWVKAQTR